MWGTLYEEIRKHKRIQIAYNLFYVLRRFIFVSLGMYIKNNTFGGIQLIIVYISNIIFTIVAGLAKSNESRLLNH
jgi:hypothetical protein